MVVVRLSRPPTRTWLCCISHPFFSDIPNIPHEQTTFFHRVFAKEGDSFEGSICDWEVMKELILRGIFEGLQELESFSILDVPDAVTSRVAQVVPTLEKS